MTLLDALNSPLCYRRSQGGAGGGARSGQSHVVTEASALLWQPLGLSTARPRQLATQQAFWAMAGRALSAALTAC